MNLQIEPISKRGFCKKNCFLCNDFTEHLDLKVNSSISFSISSTKKFSSGVSLEARIIQSVRSLTNECVKENVLDDFDIKIETYPLEKEAYASCAHLMLERSDDQFLDKVVSVPVCIKDDGEFRLSHYENIFLRHEKNSPYVERNPEVLGFLISKFTEGKDIETHNHNMRVVHLTRFICRELGYENLNPSTGMLHDSGKPFVPYNILAKPGKLYPEEFELIKMHPNHGELLLEGFPGLEQSKQVSLYHHERENGTGYQKIPGAKIPRIAKIVTYVDILDALTTERPYRNPKAYSYDTAYSIMHGMDGDFKGNCKGFFDPKVEDWGRNKNNFRKLTRFHEHLKREFPDN